MEGRDEHSPTPNGGWQYNPETRTDTSLTPGYGSQLQSVVTKYDEGATRSIDWTASEFIAHEKSMAWYAVLALITVISSGIVFVIGRDWITVIIFIMVGIILGVAAGRKPRQMQYRVDDSGFHIGKRSVPFTNFRSFAIDEEGPFANLVFLPNQRFMPITTAYVDPKDEDEIMAILGDYLPIEHHRPDFIERLMRRIRF